MHGLLLLATFLKHSGGLYERSGVQMEAWLVLGWLRVAAQLYKRVCCEFPFILASPKACEAHTWPDAPLNLSLQKFKITILPASGRRHPPMLEHA